MNDDVMKVNTNPPPDLVVDPAKAPDRVGNTDPLRGGPQPQVGSSSSALLRPDQLGDESGGVTMVFPRPVQVRMDDGRVVSFPSGVQQVPPNLAEHWYLKAHGVQRYDAGNATARVNAQKEEADRLAADRAEADELLRQKRAAEAEARDKKFLADQEAAEKRAAADKEAGDKKAAADKEAADKTAAASSRKR